jgi:hydroxyquinol 1,2-dioxygenase
MAIENTRNLTDGQLTQAVLDSFRGAPSARLREIAGSLVRHLHGFVEEVQLTEDEWFAGIGFLTAAGHITDAQRQEFILLSDVLGISMLVVALNNRKPQGATQATVFGPFFVEGSPRFTNGDDIARGAPGEPCLMQGRVLSTDGSAIAGARLEVWQADDEGFYDVQYEGLEDFRGRGHTLTEADGRWWFWSVRPKPYPIPVDGPVGALLSAAKRSPMRPAHVHFRVSAEGFETLTTHVFADGDEYLDSDAVFGVKSELIAPFEHHESGVAPDGTPRTTPFYTLSYDLVLAARE